MREGHIAGAFTFARALAFWPAEQGEEIIPADHAVGDFNCAQSGRQILELRPVSGGDGDGVQHLLGTEPARTGVGEVEGVVLVPAVGNDAQLVGLRPADVPHEMAQIVAALHKFHRQRIEERRVAGRIAGADVVHRIDDAASEEIAPKPVHCGLRKVGIVGRGQPFGEGGAAILTGGNGRRFAIRNLRRDGLIGLGMPDFATVEILVNDVLRHLLGGVGFVRPDQGVASERAPLEGYLREIGAERVILVLGPALERMIVALVAVETNTQEGLRDILGHFARITECAEIIAGRVFEGASLGEDEVAHQLIVGTIGRELFLNPAAENPHALSAEVLRIALEQVGEFVGPEPGEGGGTDQFIDQSFALLL